MARGSNETEIDDGGGRARRRNAQQLVTVLCRRLARKDQVVLVSKVPNTNNYAAYLARKDQEVEMRARSKDESLYIR